MTLTHDDVKNLERRFAADEHKIRYDNYAYVDEFAIKPRLDEVDPGWSFSIDEVTTRQGVDQLQVSVRGTMTIKGISRSGVGMSNTIGEVKSGEKKGTRYDKEAEKNAATDCLRRCARLFGIGSYLLRAPQFNNIGALKSWLGESKQSAMPKSPPNRVPVSNSKASEYMNTNGREAAKVKPGTKRDVTFTHVLPERKSNSILYSLFASTGERVGTWQRTPIVKKGYIAENDWEHIDEKKAIDPQIPATIEMKDNGYWDITAMPEFKPEDVPF